MKKRSICWNITSKCNEKCKFCYRILTNNENDIEKNKRILEILIKLSIDKISWTGGEALLYNNLIDLLKIAKEHGIANNLLTNGKLLSKEKIIKLEPFLDYITLSYDSIDDGTNDIMGRGKEHGKNVINVLNFIKEENINIKVKINTLVSKANKKQIIDVGKTIEKYNIERWKLFKFMPLRNYSINNSKDFEISDDEFKSIVSKIRELYGEKIKISECDENTIQSHYLLINSMGDFIITENFKDKKIYDIDENNIEKLKKYL